MEIKNILGPEREKKVDGDKKKKRNFLLTLRKDYDLFLILLVVLLLVYRELKNLFLTTEK